MSKFCQTTYAGLLTYEVSTSSQAAVIMKELVSQLTDLKTLAVEEYVSQGGSNRENEEVTAIKSTCSIFENVLSNNGIPNEHVLSVISLAFVKLGKWTSIIYCMFCPSFFFSSVVLRCFYIDSFGCLLISDDFMVGLQSEAHLLPVENYFSLWYFKFSY